MKKILFIVVISVMSIATIKAQEIRLGAKAGLNFSTFRGDDLGNLEPKTGIHIGALVEIPITERFAVQPEILYTTQGASYERNETILGLSFSSKSDVELQYIQVPLIAKFYVIDRLAIEAGPQIGFLASSKGTNVTKLGDETISESDEIENVSNIDAGLVAGVSYRLPLGVFFSARYNYGLQNINDDSNTQKVHNNVLQVSVGYSF